MPLIMKKTIDGQPVKIRLTDGTLYAGLPIGFILPSFEDETPLGFLKMTDTLANRTVSRTTYKELFDWATARGLIGTGKPFGDGDGSTTFVIPDGKEIAFKGIGEYEGTVGAHVKTGGLANGEFIDDRVQEHTHNQSPIRSLGGAGSGTSVYGEVNLAVTYATYLETGKNSGRKGNTTEVKSLGCHYYIKAKNVGVPADFVSAIDDVIGERLSYSTTEINTGKTWIDGKPIYSKVIEIPFTQGVEANATISGVSATDFQVIDMGHTFICNYSTYGTRQPWLANANNDVEAFYLSNGTIRFRTTHSSGTLYAVCEYTKTT